MTAREAPADLRARVVARIEESAGERAGWSPARLGWVGAALALVAVAYFAWPPRPAPIAEPDAVVAGVRPPAPPARATRTAPADAAQSEVPVRERAPDVIEAEAVALAKRLERAVAVASVVEPEPYEFRAPRLVARLDDPEPIEIEPVPAEPFGFTRIAVEPLAFERLAIEPIGGSR